MYEESFYREKNTAHSDSISQLKERISILFKLSRQAYGYTQVDVCKFLDASQGYISRVEKGQLCLSLEHWLKYSEKLGISDETVKSEELFYEKLKIYLVMIMSNKRAKMTSDTPKVARKAKKL